MSEVMEPVSIGMVPDVMDASIVQIPSKEDAESSASQSAIQLRSLGYEARGVAVTGDPSLEIVEYAKKWPADLIVVGSDERHGIEKLFSGSVAEPVVKHAPCSVLVIKRHPQRT